MVEIFTDRRMLDHLPAPRHPERPERLGAIFRNLERTGLGVGVAEKSAREATEGELLRVHTPRYLAELSRFEAGGGGLIEADTWVRPGSLRAARLAAGACLEAVSYACAAHGRRALSLVRPPGHHARPDGAMGFCLFANAAVAALDAVDSIGLDRVLIVDWDVHHGNGTQEIFDADPRVAFLSIHRSPFYPGTGAADETGTGRALGTKRNVPLPFGTSRAAYRAAFRSALETLADRTRPQLVIISAGFDAHAEDPVGSLGLEIEDFEEMTRDVLAVAKMHAEGRVVSILEGGYNAPILAGCVAAHLVALGGQAATPG